MASYSALDIAHWFIRRNQETVETMGGEKMTLLKLLKLLYYAEGCSLALDRGSLFTEDIVAWEHGPVVVEVYDAYDDPYNLPLTREDCRSADSISPEDSDTLEQVFNEFGQYTAWALRNKTHTEAPWLEATNGGKVLKGTMSRETMKRYFKENYVS